MVHIAVSLITSVSTNQRISLYTIHYSNIAYDNLFCPVRYYSSLHAKTYYYTNLYQRNIFKDSGISYCGCQETLKFFKPRYLDQNVSNRFYHRNDNLNLCSVIFTWHFFSQIYNLDILYYKKLRDSFIKMKDYYD